MAMFEVLSEAEQAALDARKNRQAPAVYREFAAKVTLTNGLSQWFRIRLGANESAKGAKQNLSLAAKERSMRVLTKKGNSQNEFYVRFTNVPRKTRGPRKNGKVKVIRK